MKEMQKDPPVILLSFRQAKESAARQIPEEFFDEREMPFRKSCLCVMAEVYMLREDLPVKVDGEDKPAGQVQEVFKELTADHVRSVMGRLENLPRDRVRNMKKYLRTALYNDVLAGEAQDLSDVGFWMKKT